MEATCFGWKVIDSLQHVGKQSIKSSQELSRYLSKQIWSANVRGQLLDSLASLFTNPQLDIGLTFRPLLLEIVYRTKIDIVKQYSTYKHQLFCVALSRYLQWPEIKQFCLEYMGKSACFIQTEEQTDEPKKKKSKKQQVSQRALARAAWLFTHHLGYRARDWIPLGKMLTYLQSTDIDTGWFAAQCVMELQQMSSANRHTFLLKYFTDDEVRLLTLRHNQQMSDPPVDRDQYCPVEKQEVIQSHTRQLILDTDLSDNVVCVCGVLLPKVATTTETDSPKSQNVDHDLLYVPSTETSLHSLALAVSSGSPVLLQGPVGAGKTSLVEHLGRITGRVRAPQLMKIQLGDQMDSKALLGTYRCTEVVGEFVWQPGVLTQAVTNGYWVLLEDIDFAPMEVISVLLPLLETRCLSVPGHGDSIRAAPGFQLFATQRLLGGKMGWYRQQSGRSVLLEKMWSVVTVESLSRTELSQVICSKYPQLNTVIDRLLAVYFMLTAGDHDNTTDDFAMETDTQALPNFSSHDSRLISTRDLMNWCHRIANDFDVQSTATANLVFQEAVDCFLACVSKAGKRSAVSEVIGAKLNISKATSEYYSCKYKPDVKVTSASFSVGRSVLPVQSKRIVHKRFQNTFSFTRQSSILLERVAVCVMNCEPVLLVGETGTGKTSSVQYLAEHLGHKLHVINMNQQSDSADLLGGFKPVDLRMIIKPFYEDFELSFMSGFSRKQNSRFLGHLQDCFSKRKWETLFSLMEHTVTSGLNKFEKDAELLKKWEQIEHRLKQLKIQVQQTQNALAFAFIEGTLVKAIRNGDWVLLDEINLAAMETLECLSGLLESQTGSVVLIERGDVEPVVRHKDFRLFACMNPATDVGKKDLSPGIRNRFTELFVDELEETADLKILVSDYLRGLSLTTGQVDGVVKFYLLVRQEASKKLTDGTGHPPHFSLRTLCRALRFAASNSCGQVPRSLYEGFCLSFLTQLNRSSHPVVERLVCQNIIGKSNIKSVLKQKLPEPSGGGRFLQFEGYWLSAGRLEPEVPDNYILTPSVRANLKDLVRVVSAGQHPVLLQGETSVGKTSLITWLARSSGNDCVRVNNHEHTDLQEYVGCYAADQSGKLVFKEGVLVEAMRKGHWVILDELNLAPTDVLEALNRLLDDNRELYIPETQETVKAHKKFMLFATQNPPGQYGGRKMLSRAFRNRFVELHFDEIPSAELETILHLRCSLPMSYAKRLIAVMLELQTRRRGSGVFAGKLGFMTLRDLFRWADRYKCEEMEKAKVYNWDKHLAEQGFMLLAGRVRKPEEVDIIHEVIQKHFKCKVNTNDLYSLSPTTSLTTKTMLGNILNQTAAGFHHVVWTRNMRRLAVLIGQALLYKEPVLLVGETGCGKTTICQMYASLYQTVLHSVNCHLHTESADFLGGLRPVRSHSQDDEETKLFEWVDGPLVTAMKTGSMFLIDEISLADDSVLERLNSVLEPERTLLLAEKGGGDGLQNEVEQVTALGSFHVFATMNPGGDFGKKELSPALRNRFTEIWCPASSERQDLIDIIEHNVKAGVHLCNQEDGTSGIGRAILDFVDFFRNNQLAKRCTVSIRDILSWVNFINTCAQTLEQDQLSPEGTSYNRLEPAVAYIHGACLVFLDGLGAGTTSQGRDSEVLHVHRTCQQFLLRQVNTMTHQAYKMADVYLHDNTIQATWLSVEERENDFCIPPFSITKGDHLAQCQGKYALQAHGPCVNAQRILRALQLSRPLLLEGSPGVGKTSLVSAIARAAGRNLVRINLSEQTDVSDLFGADLPVEGGRGGMFAWRDGPLLQALKNGDWVVLDELNLASQSVLEGLNACLDHRAEVYIPELGKTFHIQHEKTRLFACQNPLNQGGGRKGLPRSFLNRFTQVYIEPLSETDLQFIAGTLYPDIPRQILNMMITFNTQIHQDTVVKVLWGQRGGPWEFNLRDLFRWCDLLIQNQSMDIINPGEYVGLIYTDRMRTIEDKQKVHELYKSVFPEDLELYISTGVLHCSTTQLQVGHSFLPVKGQSQGDGLVVTEILRHCLQPLESLMKCVGMNWMANIVGPQACGKSSLVKTLAALTGNQLHVLAMNSAMDTTELLGGFEQADLRRHIEEVWTSLNLTVQALCQCILVSKSAADAIAIVDHIQDVRQECIDCQGQDIQGTSSEEVEQMRKNVRLLLRLLVRCKTVAKEQNLPRECLLGVPKLKKQLKTLKENLCEDRVGQCGGTFEWVDSLLVKCLKTGHWLLIDNVNFCSPSVLDRLNALLEPNGVLSINERGVIDGQIPTIRPHPNFRLFLAMDPKYGEISRAMRNRGVEIYIPGEDDGSPFPDTDVRLILGKFGLKSKTVFDWLTSLHNLLKEELPRGDKPGFACLIQAAGVIEKELGHGVVLDKSLWTACYTVYVQGHKHKISKQTALTILKNHFVKWTEERNKLSIDPELGVYPVQLPDTEHFQRDPESAEVLCNVNVLVHILEQITTCSNELKSDQNRDPQNLVKPAVHMVTDLTSATNRKLTVDWLQSYLTSKVNSASLKTTLPLLTSLGNIMDFVYSSLSNMGHRTLTNQLPASVSELLDQNPLDLQWNKQALDRVYLNISAEQERGETKGQLTRYWSRVHVLKTALIEIEDMKGIVHTLQSAVERDQKRSRPILHPAIVHLISLFVAMETVVRTCVPMLELESYTDVVQTLSGLRWLGQLLLAGVTAVRARGPETAARLSLFWHWFEVKAMSVYTSVQSSEVQQLQAVTSHLDRLLGHDDDRRKLFVKFWRSWGHPPPYQTEDDFLLQQKIQNIVMATDVYVEAADVLKKSKVKAVTCRRQYLLSRCSQLLALNKEDAEKVFAEMTIYLKSLGIHAHLPSDMETDNTDDQIDAASTPDINDNTTLLPVHHVRLWPVFEYISSLIGWSLLGQRLHEGVQEGQCDMFADFCMQYTPTSPTDLDLYRSANHKDQKEVLTTFVQTVLHHLRWNTSVRKPSQWLTWGNQQKKDFTKEQTQHGNYSIHSANLSYAMFVLATGSKDEFGGNRSEHQLTSTLEKYQGEITMLALVGNQLWSHAAVYNSPKTQSSYLETSSLMGMFCRLLQDLLPLIPTEHHDNLTQCLSTVTSQLTDGQLGDNLASGDLASIREVVSSIPLITGTPVQQLVSQCCDSVEVVIKDNKGTSCHSDRLEGLGTAWAHLGLLHLALVAPTGPVDPVEKQAIKVDLLKKELEEIEAELEVRCTHHRLVTGQELINVSPSLVHPRIPYLLSRAREITLQIQELSTKIAHRPSPSQFIQLVHDVKDYMENIGSQSTVKNLLTKLHTVYTSNTSAGTRTSQEVEMWVKSQEKFMERLNLDFPLYRDLVTPFLAAVSMVVHGVSLVSHCVQQKTALLSLSHTLPFTDTMELQGHLEGLLRSVSVFPSVSKQYPNCLTLATTLTSDQTLTLTNEVLQSSFMLGHVSMQLLTSCLKHLQNEAMTRKTLTPDLLMTFRKVMEMFVTTWQREEQQRRQKEEEEASLYRYKSEIHGDERSEEQRLEEEFRENFPVFENDFADLVEPNALDNKNPKGVAKVMDREEEDQKDALFHISPADMEKICEAHKNIFLHHVKTNWFRPVSTSSLQVSDWASPVLTSYHVASTLGKEMCDTLGSSLDSQLVGGHLLVSSAQRSQITPNSVIDQADSPPVSISSPELLPQPHVYDIYHDPNIPAIRQCEPALLSLVTRVKQLQEEWPDHPTLKQICDVVDRIRSFPVTSPVVKYLSGLELLLSKAQDWESIAASFVSLAPQLNDLSIQIVQWRKLELSCWRQSLDNAVTRCRQKAARWWFYMYQLVQSFLQPQEDSTETDEDTVKTLKQFLEKSTLGEYHIRLDILLSFHCQLVTMETSPKQEYLMNLLWNVHQFYSRFSGVVSAEIAKRQAPIEKELKGFVKIARWSDLNYWSLKQTTEKTHRTLHKHVKKFQDVLLQPVSGILGETDSQGHDTESTWREAVVQYGQKLGRTLVGTKALQLPPLRDDLAGFAELLPLQCRLPTLSTKFNKHWRQVVAKTKYAILTVTLDEFIGELIEGIHELQSLEVTKGDDKEKQKSEAKHINLKKRKALSELFRHLSALGLSYRKGLMKKNDEEDKTLLVPAFDIKVVADTLQSYPSESHLPEVWQGCIHYYYRCVARRAQFDSGLTSPSKELGMGNLERCKGFTEHLYRMLIHQFSTTSTLSQQYIDIRSQVSAIERLHSEENAVSVVPQDKVQHWLTTLATLVVQIQEGLNQFLTLLQCCPERQEGITLHPSPLPADKLATIALIKKGDEQWNTIFSDIQNVLNETKTVHEVLQQQQEKTAIIWSDIDEISGLVSKLKSTTTTIQNVSKLFCDPESAQSSCFNEVLDFLCEEIDVTSADFDTFLHELNTKPEDSQVTQADNDLIGQFCEKVEGLTSSVLLAVQSMSKDHLSETSDTSKGKSADTEDDEDSLLEGHLVNCIYDSQQRDIASLHCSKVLNEMKSALDCVTSICGNTGKVCLSILGHSLPLMEQYTQVVHHQLVCAITTQRSIGKILSVLLGVFTDLLTKGFCLPPEYSDEMQGEGATEFCDIEGGGIGEGEGVKDVSDQIETEDQLEEAKRPEDYKEEDKSDEPDVKNEDNAIEMSEDFSGRPQDIEGEEKDEDDSDQEKEEEEMDKQMGDVDNDDDDDKLDDQMWGSDEEDGPQDEEEKKEEFGPGDGKQSESELVAKDDNQDKTQQEEDKSETKEEQEEGGPEEDNKETKPHNLDQMDQDEYDDDHVDPYHQGKEEEKEAPDDLDLPDDLNLDGEDKDAGDKEEEHPGEEGGEDVDETKLPVEEQKDEAEAEQKQEGEEPEEKPANQDQDMDTGEEQQTTEGEQEEEHDRKEETGQDDVGFSAQDDAEDKQQPEGEEDKPEEDQSTQIENYGKKSHDSEAVEQSDTAQDQAGQADNSDEQADGTGAATSEQLEGNEGETSSKISTSSGERKRKQFERQPGKSDSNRSLGSTEQKYKKLKTVDTNTTESSQQDETDTKETKEAEMYEHIKDADSHHDAQTLDVATADQQDKQPMADTEAGESDHDDADDVQMHEDQEEDGQDVEEMSAAKLKQKKKKDQEPGIDEPPETMETREGVKQEIEGDIIGTDTVARGNESTIHTAMEHLHIDHSTVDLEKLRADLETQLGSWNLSNVPGQTESTAAELWHRYEALTASLSQDLCEQLRLVLEPSQATKLKGDYRTGKRLNMRKVIPYIASQFRKDKIWLRRTKPSKRQYQIMLAIDDSSSMVDNHSKQLAFESLSLVSNALTLLEAGDLAICSFGETVKLLHPFTEQFSSQSGAQLLQYLTFEQKKTKIAQLLKTATAHMMDARSHKQGIMGNPETSQLLLIVSDGRGLFMEGMEVVKEAVRQAREANVFIVFVIIDNPENKDSILDIKVPVFRGDGQMPEIKTYMENFPFPFYILLRDINSLPQVLSDALRQWFELVTSVDR